MSSDSLKELLGTEIIFLAVIGLGIAFYGVNQIFSPYWWNGIIFFLIGFFNVQVAHVLKNKVWSKL